MIIVDASETRTNSALPDLEGAVSSPVLEAVTGADLMLSMMNAPASTELLIKKHLEAGAVLVQRKSGRDLTASIGERMNSSLAKMVAHTVASWQRVLLFIGYIGINSQNNITINKQHTGKSFAHVQGALSWWLKRGGVVETIPRTSLLSDWCNIQLKQLQKMKDEPIKEFYPSKPVVQQYNDFLQVLVPVNDARITLATLPGIGPKTASILYNGFKGDAMKALCWLTDTKTTVKLKGIGRKTKENVRAFLQIPDGLRLGYTNLEDTEESILEELGFSQNDTPPWED